MSFHDVFFAWQCVTLRCVDSLFLSVSMMDQSAQHQNVFHFLVTRNVTFVSVSEFIAAYNVYCNFLR